MQDLTSSQTVLLPNNAVMVEAFSQLAEQFNISDPDSFIDRLILVGDPNYSPPGPPTGTSIVATNQESAGLVLYSMLSSHVLLGAYDFYNNQTVRPPCWTCPSQRLCLAC